MNAIVNAVQKAKAHIKASTSEFTAKDTRRKELEKLTKSEVIDLAMSYEKFKDIRIEDLVKPILEDPECAWLGYTDIATLIKRAVPTAKTSSKSLASYASKYPQRKGWNVQLRKPVAERQQEQRKLIEL